MMDYLRKNNKKIMAVLGVFLMIAFIVPTVSKRPGGPGERAIFGRVGQTPITGSEYVGAKSQWEFLSRQRLPMGRMALSLAEMTFAQKLASLMPPEQAVGEAQRIVRKLDAIDYLLLLREADRANVHVDTNTVEQILAALAPQLPPDDSGAREQAVAGWMRILANFDRIANAAKISPAMARHEVADTSEQISLKLVDFKADEFKSAVGPPTPQQLEEFFNKHKSENEGEGEMGLGYRYPNRVRIQYIRVPVPEIRKQITEEEIYKEYKDHPEAYPSTQPTTAPSTQAATQPSRTAIASTQPTTKPIRERLAEVHDRVRDRLAATAAAAVAKNVTQIMAEDWPLYRQTLKESGADAAGKFVSKLGVPYTSDIYLQRIVDRVQSLKEAHGARPAPVTEPDELSAKQLQDVPGIGKSYTFLGRQPVAMPVYTLQFCDPFMSPKEKAQAQEFEIPTLALYQPSPIFRDTDGNLYVMRIVNADPAHVPTSMAGLEKKAREDYITFQAYQKAKEAANKCLAQAKEKGLEPAAKATDDRPVITTESFVNDPRATLAKPKLPDVSYPKLIEGGFELLAQRLKSGQEHPLSVIELPRAASAMVAQLQDAKPAIADMFFDQMVMQARRQMAAGRSAQMLEKWFDPDSLRTRSDYVPEKPEGKDESPHPGNAPERPPLF